MMKLRFFSSFSFFSLLRGSISNNCSLAPISPHSKILAVLATLIVTAILAPAPALAGKYEIVKGKGVKVCEAYGKNLNSFEPDYTMMICERRVDPVHQGFAKPEWSALTEDNEVELRLGEHERTRRLMGWDKTGEYVVTADSIRNKIRQGYDPGYPIIMEQAIVDINNDGKAEKVLKERQGSCPAHRAFSVTISVLTEDGKHSDLDKSKYINPDLSKIAAQFAKDTNPNSLRTAGIRRDDIRGYLLYDIFLYKGTSYFDLWEMGKGYPDPSVARLRVFTWQNGATRELCTYRFTETVR